MKTRQNVNNLNVQMTGHMGIPFLDHSQHCLRKLGVYVEIAYPYLMMLQMENQICQYLRIPHLHQKNRHII